MEKRTKITNQVELASLIGVTPDHLSRGKLRKGFMSAEKYTQLAIITGISRDTWMVGSRRKLAKELKEFFRAQKLRD